LSPTFVHGMLYKEAGVNFTGTLRDVLIIDEEVATYMMVRKAILKESPYCKFSILVDAQSFLTVNLRSLSALVRNYNYFNSIYPDFKIDAVHFENWTAVYEGSKANGNYAIQYLHSMNLIVGGNIYDTSDVPGQTDYVGLSTDNFIITSQIESSPAIGLINNLNPFDFSSEACAWINYTRFKAGRFQEMTDVGRIQVLQSLKVQQSVIGFSMAWPVFAPLCPAQNAFDSTKGEVYNWIKQNALEGPINHNDYQIKEMAHDMVVTPFRRNISTPASPNGSSDVFSSLSFLLMSYLLHCILHMDI
jgi:hypothetical protein